MVFIFNNNEFNSIKSMEGHVMGRTIATLLMVLIGFVVAMLGLIYAIHSQDVYLGLLISVGGIASMLMGLPNNV